MKHVELSLRKQLTSAIITPIRWLNKTGGDGIGIRISSVK
jgi:hypothetical protein